ncbi:putative aliphatic sulfonates transport permease protein SsuC [Micromonospora sonchi]|uniref:Aliphatic sulfonates transport permease protein SsuC n=1 Tax=Micromonospora sonchi TaxID=1763543 RepID=A0A917U8Q3_9ACTN|nr:ABC transporter permease [Micromonospora sonchi]GGM62426.1 putative aliphatic sulfonates transport permease protein SsuC [Micromonospora sonchi]
MSFSQLVQQRAPGDATSPRDAVARRRGRRDPYVGLIRLGVVVAGLALWQLLTATGVVGPRLLPPPGSVAQVLSTWVSDGTLWPNLGSTTYALVLGVVIGTLGGTVVAYVLAAIPPLAVALNPYLVAINGLPRAALAPLFLLWYGIGTTTQVAMATLLIFFHAFLTVYEGLLGVDRRLLDNLTLLGARRYDVFRLLYLPVTAFRIVTSLKASIGLGFLGVVVGEYMGATTGLGALLASARSVSNLDRAVAALVLIALVAAVIAALVGSLSARFESRSLK